MMPIHELLNRIQWDEEFARAEFRIGYYDRVKDDILIVSMNDVFRDPNDHFSVQIFDEEGCVHMVPMHRIKQVSRNGELIWHRER